MGLGRAENSIYTSPRKSKDQSVVSGGLGLLAESTSMEDNEKVSNRLREPYFKEKEKKRT